MTKLQDVIAGRLAGNHEWIKPTSALGHAIIERALTMPLPELLAFVAPTPASTILSHYDNNELSSSACLLRAALLSDSEPEGGGVAANATGEDDALTAAAAWLSGDQTGESPSSIVVDGTPMTRQQVARRLLDIVSHRRHASST